MHALVLIGHGYLTLPAVPIFKIDWTRLVLYTFSRPEQMPGSFFYNISRDLCGHLRSLYKNRA